ncbi:MAG: hypothetical protein KKA70_12705 [Proteobacteria bacterium]|nr:hypothetical protein [Pseudomonadota bacterium]MBU1715450.1 hypothetical protein [Pseudomonadota bacterium]
MNIIHNPSTLPIRTESLKNVGIVGIPPVDFIRFLNERQVVIHDLDALLTKADIETATAYLPKVYCAILRTVMLNGLHLNLDAIIIDVGPGKCDAAYHVATILEETVNIPVIRTANEDMIDLGTPVCRTRMNLLKKFKTITEGVKSANPADGNFPACKPAAGFWGVPPRDFSILSLFPDTTHIYGWTRCMENKTPANINLESHYNPKVPTVFFAQSFCAKTALARHLATRHPQGLYLDVDFSAGSSAKAKIQAFLELTGVAL